MAVETKLPRASHHKKCYGEDLDSSMQSREGVTCINRLLMATGAALTICTASGLFRRDGTTRQMEKKVSATLKP